MMYDTSKYITEVYKNQKNNYFCATRRSNGITIAFVTFFSRPAQNSIEFTTRINSRDSKYNDFQENDSGQHKDKDDINANQHQKSWPKQPNQNDGNYVPPSSFGVVFHATQRSSRVFEQQKCFDFEGCHAFELSSSCYVFSASS